MITIREKKWTNTDAQIVFQRKLYYITVFHNNRQFLYLSTSPLYVELYDLKTQQNIVEAYTVVNFFTVLAHGMSLHCTSAFKYLTKNIRLPVI